MHFRKRPGAKKKKLKDKKLEFKKGSEIWRPKGAKMDRFGPPKWSKSEQKATQKIVTKKVREKEV